MLIFGTIGLFRRWIPLSSALLAFARAVLGTLFLLFCSALDRHGPRLRLGRRTLGLLLLSGAVMGLNWVLLFEAYSHTTVAVATLCYYMQPTILILLSPLVLRERLSRKKLLCALLSVLGMVLVSGVIGGGGARDSRGILLGLGAAALYAAVIVLNKQLTGVEVRQRTILQLSAAAATLLPYALLSGAVSIPPLSGDALAALLVVGLVHTGLAYALYFSSIEALSGQTIALFSYLDPVTALLLSALALREPLGRGGLPGALLILVSALYSELSGNTSSESFAE